MEYDILLKNGINWCHLGIDVGPDKINIVKKADDGREELSITLKNHKSHIEYSNSGILLKVYQVEKKDKGDQFSSHFINSIIENSKYNTFILESSIHEHSTPKEILKLIDFYLKIHEKGELEDMMEEYPFMNINPRVSHEETGLIKCKKDKNIRLDYKLVNPFSKLENRTEIFSINEENSENLFFKMENGKIIAIYTTMNIPKAEEIVYKKNAHPKLIELMKRATAMHFIGSFSSKEVINKEEAIAMFKSFYEIFKQQPHTAHPGLYQ